MNRIAPFALAAALLALLAASAAAAQSSDPRVQPSPFYGQPAASSPRYADTDARYAAAPAASEEEDDECSYEWPGIAIGVRGGTTGVGPELTLGLNPYFNLRAAYNFASFNFKRKIADVKWDLDVDMDNIPVFLDVYPFAGNFRISAGAVFQSGSEATLDAVPERNVTIGDHKYTPEVVGTLTGKVKTDSDIAPYIGIGFGNSVGKDDFLTLSLDLGVFFQEYEVELASNGPGNTAKLPYLRHDVEKERRKLQNDFDDWKIFPVVALSLSIHL